PTSCSASSASTLARADTPAAGPACAGPCAGAGDAMLKPPPVPPGLLGRDPEADPTPLDPLTFIGSLCADSRPGGQSWPCGRRPRRQAAEFAGAPRTHEPFKFL